MSVPQRVAITGAAGQLGRQLVDAFEESGNRVLALARPDFDITRAADLQRLSRWRPDIVVNAAAWTDVDGCARDPGRAMRVNGVAAGAVAEAAASAGALVVQVSTNEVFDGSLDRPYTEDDAPNPINPYGASKLAGEQLVRAANRRSLIVRTAWLFGPGGANFVTKIIAAAERAQATEEPLRLVEDEWGNPTWTPSLAVAIASAVGIPAVWGGMLNLAGEPACTRLEWGAAALAGTGRPPSIEPVGRATFSRLSTPPARAILAMDLADGLGLSVADWRPITRDYVAAL